MAIAQPVYYLNVETYLASDRIDLLVKTATTLIF